MIRNIKISINLLLIVLLSIAVSNVLPEHPILDEIIEAEEIEEFKNHIESTIHQNEIQSIGAGGDVEINILSNIFTNKINFPFLLKFELVYLLIDKPFLNPVPFFIQYCSLIIYS